MWLEQQLKLARQPWVNRPIWRWWKRINAAQELARQSAFETMQTNWIEGEKRYKKQKKREHLEQLKNNFELSEDLSISDTGELQDYLHIIMWWNYSGHWWIRDNNDAMSLCKRYTPRTIFLFFAVQLWLMENNIYGYDSKKRKVQEYINNIPLLKSLAKKLKLRVQITELTQEDKIQILTQIIQERTWYKAENYIKRWKIELWAGKIRRYFAQLIHDYVTDDLNTISRYTFLKVNTLKSYTLSSFKETEWVKWEPELSEIWKIFKKRILA